MPNWKEIVGNAHDEIRRQETLAQRARAEAQRAEDAKKLLVQQRTQWEKLKAQEHLRLVPAVMEKFQVREFLEAVRSEFWKGYPIRPTSLGFILMGPSYTETYTTVESKSDSSQTFHDNYIPTLFIEYLCNINSGTDIQRRLQISWRSTFHLGKIPVEKSWYPPDEDYNDYHDNFWAFNPICKRKCLCDECTLNNNICIDIEQHPNLAEQRLKDLTSQIAQYKESTSTPPKQPWYKKLGF